MEDLNSSTFFDEHTLNFLQNMIWRGPKKSEVVTGLEAKLLERHELVFEINEALGGKLITLLTSWKEYVAVPNAIIFIMASYKRGLLKDAVNAMDSAVQEEFSLSAEQLKELLDEAEFTPMIWNVMLFGDSAESRYKEDPLPIVKSGLDLERLRNFK